MKMILKIQNFEFMKDFALKSKHEKRRGEERTRREKEEEEGERERRRWRGGGERKRVTDRCKLNREELVSKSSETVDPEFQMGRKRF